MSETQKNDGRFENSDAGLTALGDRYSNWTTQLGDRSIAACYAIIGAAWAVYGDELKSHALAMWAIAIAIGYLFLSAGITLWVAELLRDRFDWAQNNRELWKKEWETSADASSKWPYTQKIACITIYYHRAKFFVPLLSGVFLVISFICA